MRWLSIVALVSCFASAQPSSTDPKELFKQGRQRYEAGDFTEAAALFQRSYDLSKAPALLFNLAQAHRRRGACAEAATSYRAYLASASSKDKNLGEANDYAAAMERCVRDAATPSAKPPLEPPAPEPTSLMSLNDTPPPPPSKAPLITAVVFGGLGVAAAGIGTGLLLSANNHARFISDVIASWMTPSPWTTELDARQKQGLLERSVGLGLVVGAAVAVGIAAVTFLVGALSKPTEEAVAWHAP